MPGRFGRIRKFAVSVQTIWTIVLIALLIGVFLEGVSRLPRLFRHRGAEAVDPRTRADGYHGNPWIAEYFREFEAAGKLEWRPYVYWRRKAFAGKHINIDENGLRRTWERGGGDAAAQKETNSALEVLMFGGSTLWGTGARDAFTIPSILSRKLAERGVPNVRVSNWGETGYVTTQELIALELELRERNVPVLAVFFDGVNDVFSAFQSGTAGIPQNEMHRIEEFNILNPVDRGRLSRSALNTIAERSTTVRMVRRALRHLPRPSRPPAGPAGGKVRHPDAALARQVVATYVENIKLVEALGEAYGFECLFFWQPVIFMKNRRTPFENKIVDEQESISGFYSEVYEEIANDSTLNHNPRFVNISQVFADDGSPHFIDFCHLTEEGNGIVAEAMYPSIEEKLRVRSRSTAGQ